jgi:hypothetical protein
LSDKPWLPSALVGAGAASLLWLLQTTTPVASALPTAVVGSFCRPGSTPTQDPDGATIYCAIISDLAESSVWSRRPGPFAIRSVTDPTNEAEGPWFVVLCEQQTGRSFNYCNVAIKQSSYQGDGRIPES